MLDVVLNAFATLFVVIDPLGLLPLFLALTAGHTPAERRRVALRGTAIAAIVLFAFALVGSELLDLLGIGLPAFRVAGGLMLLWIAFEMVFERRTDRRTRSAEEIARQEAAEDIAVFPLAIPLLSGPGAITSVMLLMGRHEGQLPSQAAVLLVLALVLALCVLIFWLAEPTERLLGPTATNVISRLLGILLAALAVQYVLDGLASGLSLASS
jgi:multiple antibiotic resistance protein